MGQKNREIYDAKYYKTKEILKKPSFWHRLKTLKTKFAQFNCPLPRTGFRTKKQFHDWWIQLGQEYGKVINSGSYKGAVQKITKGQEKWGQKEQDELEKLEEVMLPPIAYGYELDKILEDFGLDPKNENDKSWIEQVLFFNKRNYPYLTSAMKIIWNKKGKKELWSRIFPHTKNIPMKAVRQYQKYLDGYKSKYKPRNEYVVARNKQIVDMYLREKKRLDNMGWERSKKGQAIASKIVGRLKQKYPKLTKGTVEKVVSHI